LNYIIDLYINIFITQIALDSSLLSDNRSRLSDIQIDIDEPDPMDIVGISENVWFVQLVYDDQVVRYL